jgi:hypothetical protein
VPLWLKYPAAQRQFDMVMFNGDAGCSSGNRLAAIGDVKYNRVVFIRVSSELKRASGMYESQMPT